MDKKIAPATKGNESAQITLNNTTPLNLPDIGTQPARMLALLLKGRKVTPLEAWIRLGIYRISDTVYQLRQANWGVITDRKEVHNRFGEECRVALYSLPASEILRAGQRGQEFAEKALRNYGGAV